MFPGVRKEYRMWYVPQIYYTADSNCIKFFSVTHRVCYCLLKRRIIQASLQFTSVSVRGLLPVQSVDIVLGCDAMQTCNSYQRSGENTVSIFRMFLLKVDVCLQVHTAS